MIKNFRTYSIAVEFYHLATALNPRRPLKDQLERAASSIVLNLAEGSGKSSPADRGRFYQIAFGSLRECQSVLDLTQAEGPVLDTAEKLAAHLYRLIKSTA